MNLKLIQPENKTEDLLLSLTKNCETLIKQTHRRAEETLENKFTKLRKTFHLNPPILVEGSWMTGVTSLEVHNSIFSKTKENIKFELYIFPNSKIVGISYEKVRDEVEEDLGVTDVTAIDLQDELIGPNIIEEYREQVTKRMKNHKYMDISAGYTSSIFFKILRVISEQKLIWLKMILDWF